MTTPSGRPVAWKLTAILPGSSSLLGNELVDEITEFVPPVLQSVTEDYSNSLGVVKTALYGISKMTSTFKLRTVRSEFHEQWVSDYLREEPGTYIFRESIKPLVGADVREFPGEHRIVGRISMVDEGTYTLSDTAIPSYEASIQLEILAYQRRMGRNNNIVTEIDLRNNTFLVGKSGQSPLDVWNLRRLNLNI